MIFSQPPLLMSQETKFSATPQYLGNGNNDPYNQFAIPSHDQVQDFHSNDLNSSHSNLNTFDPLALFSLNQAQNNSQENHSNFVNEIRLIHDQQVDLLNQQRIRQRLEQRQVENNLRVLGHLDTQGTEYNLRNNNCLVPSKQTCFVTGQSGLGSNPSQASATLSSTISPVVATAGLSPLSSSSHQSPPDSPIGDLTHSKNTMTLGNNGLMCNSMPPLEIQSHSTFVSSSSSSNSLRRHNQDLRTLCNNGIPNSNASTLLPPSMLEISSSRQLPLSSTARSSSSLILAQQQVSSQPQEASSTGPFLRIVEQPTNRIRYRYKSEKGSHGGLTGEHNSQSKKTYPTVRLENYRGDPNANIMVKACLVTNEDNPKPHVHKLMGRNCTPDGTCLMPLSESNEASFQNLGILFIGKKEVPEILYQRKLIESRFFLDDDAMNSGDQLSDLDRQNLREEAEREAKDMNLNCVKLSFQAFDCSLVPSPGHHGFNHANISQVAQINFAITSPVFTRSVANQKSPDSGELKIVRMDKDSGVTSGDEAVYLLCEKVNKKEIKIRFFEVDHEGNIVWEAFGHFNESDVHHQVAIVFRTPAYRNPLSESPVQVYIQLFRPKDGEYSEPRPFTYYPATRHHQIHQHQGNEVKRRKMMGYRSAPSLYPEQRCPIGNMSSASHYDQNLFHAHQQQQNHQILSVDTTMNQHSPTSHPSPTSSTSATSSPATSSTQQVTGYYSERN